MNGTHNDLLDVVVVGGSQAGLTMAWHLAQQNLRFVVLDAAPEIGHTWRSRWDSLKLFTPTQYNALPGMPFPCKSDTYPGKDTVTAYLQDYAAAFNLPVKLNARVTSLSQKAECFEIRTQDETYRARQVVVATGPFQVPYVPPAAQGLDSSVTQLHSAGYRDPQALPPGPVLVVGGGNSGFQIAEELATTRQVDLSIGTKLPMLPQRLAGKDLTGNDHRGDPTPSRPTDCFGGSPGSGCCGCPPAPGWAAGCRAGISSSAAAAACSGERASGSGHG